MDRRPDPPAPSGPAGPSSGPGRDPRLAAAGKSCWSWTQDGRGGELGDPCSARESGVATPSPRSSMEPEIHAAEDPSLLPDAVFEWILERVVTDAGEPRAHADSVVERVERALGDALDPRIDLSPPTGEALGPSASEFLARLDRRRDANSRYRVLEEIGAGGMGRVFKVWDGDLRRTLAMKVVRRERLERGSEARLLSRFLEEAQIAAQLDHPGILPVHELGLDEDGNLYFTMRLVRGRDLSAVLDARPRPAEWTLPRLLSTLHKICETLAYAHARGVLHRDLKPSNVMVGRFGEVYVMDWGLARVIGRERTPTPSPNAADLSGTVHTVQRSERRLLPASPLFTQQGDVMGTPAYMPPEQARGELEHLDARSDVYAIGAMLYHALAGKPPFTRGHEWETPREVLARVLVGPPEALARIAPRTPAELVAITEKAMARERADRYASASELASDLQAFLEGRVVAAYRSGPLVELRKWVGRNRIVAATSLALAATLLIGGATTGVLYLDARRNARELREAFVAVHRTELARLVERAPGLYPIEPRRVPELEGWLDEAHTLVAAASSLGATLREDGASAASLAELDLLERELAVLTDPERGLLEGRSAADGPGVARRLELARRMAEHALESDQARALWTQASASIADRGDCPMYAGLALAPQAGLRPVGRDPASGLWEFAVVASGEIPGRDPLTRRLEIHGGSAIVLVLLPGGTSILGSQDDDPRASHYYAASSRVIADRERPMQRVELEPFFLSKYELTQGQFLRLAGSHPSMHPAGERFGDHVHDLSHPVEKVDWEGAVRLLGWLGLALPSEAQWEYAARAGTGTPWWTGTEEKSLGTRVNIADESALSVGVLWTWAGERDINDGYLFHAPVHTFEPNGFGLHHVLGNVNEWCADPYAPYASHARHGAGGLRLIEGEPKHRPARGGGYDANPERCRAAFRLNVDPRLEVGSIGVRPARPIL